MDNFTNARIYTTAASSSLLSSTSFEKEKKPSESKRDDISLYKPISYPSISSTSSSPSSVTKPTSATMVKHKITNNFKLPPFPVYVPSTTFASTLHLQSPDPGSNNEASNNKSKDTSNPTSISHLSSVSSSSPSGLNTTCSSSTLSLGRINPYLYQSESSLTNNSNNVTMTTSITSSNTNNEVTASYTTSPFLDQQSSYNNVCSSATLPRSSNTDSYVSKISHSSSGKDNSYSYKYSTDYYSNITTTNNSSSNGTSTNSASDNIYRVQYSATNPFLDPLDPAPSTSADNGLSSIFSKASATARGASSMVSEMARKFEKLDFEEDLK